MATTFFIPLLGKRMRITTIDDCGNVPASAETGAYMVTDGFISVNLSSEVEDGAEILVKKADGTFCVNEKLASSFKRFTAELQFCGVNPSLLSFVSNATEYANADADIAGFSVAEGTIDKNFSLELWTGVQNAACSTDEEVSGYTLLPFLRAGVLGDITVDGENAVNFSITGAYTKGGNNWGVGPWDVIMDDTPVESPLPTALDPLDHLLMVYTTVAPPAANDDPQDMP